MKCRIVQTAATTIYGPQIISPPKKKNANKKIPIIRLEQMFAAAAVWPPDYVRTMPLRPELFWSGAKRILNRFFKINFPIALRYCYFC